MSLSSCSCKRKLQIPHPVLALLALKTTGPGACALIEVAQRRIYPRVLYHSPAAASVACSSADSFGIMSRNFTGKTPVPMLFEQPAVQSSFQPQLKRRLASHSATAGEQYEQDFIPHRLCNWEVPAVKVLKEHLPILHCLRTAVASCSARSRQKLYVF